MIAVKLSIAPPVSRALLLRQTPDGEGQWGRCRFVIDEAIDECDFWVVFVDVTDVERCRCDPANTLFVAVEPPSYWQYNEAFLSQFAEVWTTDPDTAHPNRSLTNPALPWYIGSRFRGKTSDDGHAFKTFEEIENEWPVAKSRPLSIISSNLQVTPEHVRRYDFVCGLKQHFGDRLDVFGRGFDPIEDKAQGILPYRYHIALENSGFPHYWTEKLADAYLGGAMPIYWGCPDIDAYFPDRSMVRIDIDDPAGAIATIEETLASDPYEDRLADISEARRRILYEHNLFARLEQAIAGRPIGAKETVRIMPEKWFRKNKVRLKLAQTALRDRFRGMAAGFGLRR